MKERRDPETGLPIIQANGKKWWQEVWGKVTAGLLLIAIPGAAAWMWFKAVAAYDATAEVYRMPPIVARHEAELRALKTKPPMTDQQIQDLAAAIVKALPAQKKAKP